MILRGKDFIMYKGASEAITVTLSSTFDSYGPLTEGDLVFFVVKERLGDDEPAVIRIVVDSFIDGVGVINIAPEDTEDLKARDYYYGIRLIRADGTAKDILQGHRFILEEACYG